MRRIILVIAIMFPLFLAAQYPQNPVKQRLGFHTTALGLTYYSDTIPLHTPSSYLHDAEMVIDTITDASWLWTGYSWRLSSTLRQVLPPLPTVLRGSNTLDHRYAQWFRTTDSIPFVFNWENTCWQPSRTVYESASTPTNEAATGTTGAVCYEYTLWKDTSIDSLKAYTAGGWITVGSGSGGGATVTSLPADSITVTPIVALPATTNVQQGLAEAGTNISALDILIGDLTTLSGMPATSTDLGAFTGVTIPDASDTKESLQALETALEAKITSITEGYGISVDNTAPTAPVVEVDTAEIATQNYVRTYHQDELTLYLANDTLANPVIFTVDTIREINVLSYQSVPTGRSSIANISVAPIGRYMFHLRNTDAQTVDFPSTFKLANGEFADNGTTHFLFKNQMWDCYSDGLIYHCNTPSGTGIYDPFLFSINTANPGTSDDSTFVMPFAIGAVNEFEVNWGDGNIESITNDTVTHTYAAPGIYSISIQGQIGSWAFENGGDKSKMVDITEWGDFVLSENAFYGCDSLTVSANDAPRIGTSIYRCFRGCTSLDTLRTSTWPVGNVVNAREFVLDCTNLSSLDVSSWNTGNFNNIAQFARNTSISELDVSNWNTSNVVNMQSFIFNCDNLTELDVSGWDVSNATNVETFAFGCANLTSLDVSNWNTGNLLNIRQFVSSSAQIDTLDVSGWDVSNVTDAGFFAAGCNSIVELDVSNWNTSNFSTIRSFAQGCTSIPDLDASDWDVTNVTIATDFLKNVTIPTATYDAILVAWEAQAVNNGISVNFGTSTYTLGSAAATARAALIADHSWTITDGGGI